MFNKFFKFLKGYVIIRVTGSDAERFINICVRRGIDVGSVKAAADGAFILRVSVSDLRSLRPIVRKKGVKIHITDRRGAFMMKRLYGKRYAFFAGALFMKMCIRDRYMPLTQHQLHGLSAPPLPLVQHH